jgi:hypothetical protein
MVDTCGKTAYPNRPEAERALRWIRRHRNQREQVPVRSYRCPDCGEWHLTANHSWKDAES